MHYFVIIIINNSTVAVCLHFYSLFKTKSMVLKNNYKDYIILDIVSSIYRNPVVLNMIKPQ